MLVVTANGVVTLAYDGEQRHIIEPRVVKSLIK